MLTVHAHSSASQPQLTAARYGFQVLPKMRAAAPICGALAAGTCY